MHITNNPTMRQLLSVLGTSQEVGYQFYGPDKQRFEFFRIEDCEVCGMPQMGANPITAPRSTKLAAEAHDLAMRFFDPPIDEISADEDGNCVCRDCYEKDRRETAEAEKSAAEFARTMQQDRDDHAINSLRDRIGQIDAKIADQTFEIASRSRLIAELNTKRMKFHIRLMELIEAEVELPEPVRPYGYDL
jgi:hypothetical protein